MKDLRLVLAIALITLIGLITFSMSGYAQTVKPSNDKVLKDTTIKSVVYKLYVGSRGGKYILRTSKSGNVYKQYIKK